MATNLFGQPSISPETKARDPAEFARLVSRGRWIPAPHLLILNDYAMKLVARKIRRLMVIEPPRHGKSEYGSHYLPSWYLGRFPDQRVILQSYEADFAAEWGRKVRDTLEEWGQELFQIRIRPTSSAAKRWDIEGHEGGMRTAGGRTGVTGKGANLYVIDDPIKDAVDAASPVIRKRVWDLYRSTAYTRMEPNGVILLIQTRWNEDDLAGRILANAKETGEEWTVLHLPAVSTRAEIFPRKLTKRRLRKKAGEPLWPWRYDSNGLEEIRKAVGPYFWNALYQGDPIPEGGAIFKRQQFRYFTTKVIPEEEEIAADFVESFRKEIEWAPAKAGDPETLQIKPDTPEWDRTVLELNEPDNTTRRFWASDLRWMQTVDTAMKTGQRNDYTVVTTFAITPAWDICVYDVGREKLELPDQFPFLMTHRRHNPMVHLTAIEEAQFGTGLVQMAKREGVTFIGIRPRGDKSTRATAIATYYNAGSVYHLSGPRRPWLDDFEDELVKFPSGEHDDQVDTMSAAGLLVLERAAKRHRMRTFDENLTPEQRVAIEQATKIRGF